MSSILVSSSVSATGVPATYSLTTAHERDATIEDAISIGNLNEQGVIVSVTDDGAEATSSVSKSFVVATAGSISLSQAIDSYVDLVFTRFQLVDGSGSVIADSSGTTEQVAAYNLWTEGELDVEPGTYTAIITPETEFTGDIALTVNSMEQQGTSLQVTSALTGNNAEEYYQFSLSGSNIKLDFDAGSSATAKNARVVLYNEDGNIVADSGGNSYQRSKYLEMTSGSGLAADSGTYIIKVTYAEGADETQQIDYNFKLYSGSTYSVIYKSTVDADAYDGSASGSTIAADDAELLEAQGYNKINTSPAEAVNIGWIQQDKSMLAVYSMLTAADNVQYYSFTFQQGDNLKFDFNTSITTRESEIRVQLLDVSGLHVIADSAGTAEQRALYEQLTSATGITANTGSYIVKISYAEGATRSDLTYEFGIYSGSTYLAQYRTIASAQTYANALLTGELGSSSAASAGIAAYLTASMNGEDDLYSNLAAALQIQY